MVCKGENPYDCKMRWRKLPNPPLGMQYEVTKRKTVVREGQDQLNTVVSPLMCPRPEHSRIHPCKSFHGKTPSQNPSHLHTLLSKLLIFPLTRSLPTSLSLGVKNQAVSACSGQIQRKMHPTMIVRVPLMMKIQIQLGTLGPASMCPVP